jgi:predicted ATP-dependent endonuclease of OLD family
LKINTLEFTNFRGIKSVKFQLEGKSAGFLGINGVGKSSILHGINILFSQIINKIIKNRFKQGINIKLSDISTIAQGCTAKAELLFSDKLSINNNCTMDRKTKRCMNISIFSKPFSEYFEQKYSDANTNIPVFVNYGANRLVLDVPVQIKTDHLFNRESPHMKKL